VYKNIKPTLSELNYKGVGVDVNSYLLDLLPNKKASDLINIYL